MYHNIEGIWYRAECQEFKDILAKCLDKNKDLNIKKESSNKN